MKKRRRFFSAAAALLFCLSAVLSAVNVQDVQAEEEDWAPYFEPDTVTMVCSDGDTLYGRWSTGDYTVTHDGVTYKAYCSEASKDAPETNEYHYIDTHKYMDGGTGGVVLYDQETIERMIFVMLVDQGLDGCADYADTLYAELAAAYGQEKSAYYGYAHCYLSYRSNGFGDHKGLTLAECQSLDQRIGELLANTPGLRDRLSNWRVYQTYDPNNQNMVWVEGAVYPGSLSLRKLSANPALTDGNPCYSLEGAVYGIYGEEECLNQVAELTIHSDGASDSVTLDAGTYWIKELTAPLGFSLSEEVQSVTLSSGEEKQITLEDIPGYAPGELHIRKLDADTREAVPEGNASLEGAEFTVTYYGGYFASAEAARQAAADGSTPSRSWVLQTRQAGEEYIASLEEACFVSGDSFFLMNGAAVMPLGTYTVQETKAPTGYTLDGYLKSAADGSAVAADSGIYLMQVTGDGGLSIEGANECIALDHPLRGGVEIRKLDLETGSTHALGAAVLEGAVFALINRSDNAVWADADRDGVREVYQPGETILTMTTDENGYAATEEQLLPYGRYEIKEVQAPEGYTDQGVVSREFEITQEDELVSLTASDFAILNQVGRGDFDLRKIDADTQKEMANVQFRITSDTTGESHVFTTDENGYYSSESSWNPHSRDTNEGAADSGLWFGLKEDGTSVEVQDALGALPYDTYTITELPGESNAGMRMYTGTLTIKRDKTTIRLNNIENFRIHISTTAMNEETGSQYLCAQQDAVITDSVSLSNLSVGTEYTLVGTVIDRDTGLALKDADQRMVSAELTFTAASQTETRKLDFRLNAEELEGRTLVVFEELYDGDTPVASHQDPNDTNQMIYIPQLKTMAQDARTGTSVANASEKVTIIDTVEYKNVKPWKRYTVSGALYDRETGEILLDASGNEITAATTFFAAAASGTAEVKFTFDGTSLAGRSAVAFEELTQNGRLLAVHADLEDTDQTIVFPKLQTTAADQKTGSHTGTVGENSCLSDQVMYTNLQPGREYTLEGILMNRETGRPFEDEIGETVTASTVFTPDSPNGTVEMLFTYKARANTTIVVFETLYLDGEPVAAHADLTDENQTVSYPAEPVPEAERTAAGTAAVPTADSSGALSFYFFLLFSAGLLFAGAVYAKRKI